MDLLRATNEELVSLLEECSPDDYGCGCDYCQESAENQYEDARFEIIRRMSDGIQR